MHARDPVEPPPTWIIVAVADAWRANGHRVEFVRGVSEAFRADLVVPHVDLTVLPPEYVAALREHPNVVNRRVVDISKRGFSRHRVTRTDSWDGPVIVKSNRNFGGLPERYRLRRRWWQRRAAQRVLHAAFRRDPDTGFHPLLPLSPSRYPIFESVRDVPRGTFLNPHLHVERFLPERDGSYYCLRCYAFAGASEVNLRIKASNPIVKAAEVADRVELPVPEELRALRAERGFDFGKIDYVIVDGQVHVLDLNRTPTFGGRPEFSERQKEIAELFARGLLRQFDLE